MILRRSLSAALLLMLGGLPGPAAHGELPQVHALTGVRIQVAPGQVIESGTVVLRDGIIEAAGAGVEPPADARVWDREGLTVYAGLIEPYALLDGPEASGGGGGDEASGSSQGDRTSGLQGGHENALVTPELDMTPYAYDEAAYRKLRTAGFTSAVFAPRSGAFRGRSVLMNLGDGGLHDNLLLRDVAQNVTIALSGSGYPSSKMGAVALVRQTFYDALWYGEAHSAYEADPRQARPPFHASLAELVAAARGQAPVVFETGDVVGTLRVASIVEELGLDAVLLGNGEEYRRLDDVAATGYPHLLPVAFPDPPDVEDADSVDLAELRHWDLAPENPARLIGAGVRVAFTSHGLSNPVEIHGKLAAAVERGLDPAQALAGLTTVPAELLGLGDRLGTVEAGKIANLLVVDGELLTEKPKLREVWIDGRHHELKELKPPEVDPAGTWELIIEAEGQKMPVTIELAGSVDNLSGSVSAPGGNLPFDTVDVSGKTVEITFSAAPMGMPGTFVLQMTIDGEKAKGAGTGPPGSFTFKGKRTKKPGTQEIER